MVSQKHFKAHDSIFKLNKIKKIQKSGLYEVWYTMFNDTTTQQGFWIRYTLLIPKQSTNQKLEGQALLWFGYSSLNDSSKNFMIKKFYPIEEAIETTSDHIIKISEAILTLTRLHGSFSVDNNQSVAWDLALSELREPYVPTPVIYKKIGLTNTIYLATHPNARIDGEISIDTTKIPIVNARGIQYHTYGDAYTTPWEWCNAHTFQHNSAAYFDFGYKVNRGVLEYFDGENRISRWNSNPLSKLRMIKRIKREFSVTSIKFFAEQKNLIIKGEISSEKDRLLGVEYLGPHNEKFYCYNTSIGDLDMEIQDGSVSQKYSILGSVAFETVYPNPIDGIPYLPWESEFIDNDH